MSRKFKVKLYVAVTGYIEFYNNRRLQQKPNYLAPADYHQFLLTAKNAEPHF